LKKTKKLWNVALGLVWAVLWAGFSASMARAQKSTPQAQKPAASAPALAKIWVSQSSGHEFRVKVENDLFTAEWVNIPAARTKLGVYIRSECHRSGTRWIGFTRALQPCAKSGEATGKFTRMCPLTLRFEVNEITPDRISGRGESLKNFNCETCEVRETGWARWVWVPKK